MGLTDCVSRGSVFTETSMDCVDVIGATFDLSKLYI